MQQKQLNRVNAVDNIPKYTQRRDWLLLWRTRLVEIPKKTVWFYSQARSTSDWAWEDERIERDISRDSVKLVWDTQSVPSLWFSYLVSWTVRIWESKTWAVFVLPWIDVYSLVSGAISNFVETPRHMPQIRSETISMVPCTTLRKVIKYGKRSYYDSCTTEMRVDRTC